MGKRQVKESPVTRGVDEEFAYKFTLTDKFPSGTYSNPANVLYSRAADGSFTTVEGGVLNGIADITTGVFTTSKFTANTLTANTRYRLHCSMDIDGDLWSWDLFIDAKN